MNDSSFPTSIDISILIANYNGSDTLSDCLVSVLSQQVDCSIEIIVHDDASSDDSLACLRQHFPTVRVIESFQNVGFCISNNKMASIAHGRYLLLLNNDAMLRPGSLAMFWRESTCCLTPQLLGLTQYALHDGFPVDHGYEFDLFMNPVPIMNSNPNEVAAVTGACLWIPRPIWDAVGGFPPWFGSVAEDIFFCQAARLLGYPTRVLDTPGFDHWIGKSLGGGKVVSGRLSTTTVRRAQSERNRIMVMLLCFPGWALLAVLPIHSLLLVLEAACLRLLGGTQTGTLRRIYLTILPDIWRQRGQLITLRHRLRTLKTMPDWHYMSRFSLWPHKLRMMFRYGLPTIH